MFRTVEIARAGCAAIVVLFSAGPSKPQTAPAGSSDRSERQYRAVTHLYLFSEKLQYRQARAQATRNEIDRDLEFARGRVQGNQIERDIGAIRAFKGALLVTAKVPGGWGELRRGVAMNLSASWRKRSVDSSYANSMRIAEHREQQLIRYQRHTDAIYQQREDVLAYYKQIGDLPQTWRPTDWRGVELGGVTDDLALRPGVMWKNTKTVSSGRVVPGDQQCSVHMAPGQDLRAFASSLHGGAAASGCRSRGGSDSLECRSDNTWSRIRRAGDNLVIVDFSVSVYGAATETMQMHFVRCDDSR